MGDRLETAWISGLTAQHARREAKHRAHIFRPQDGLASMMVGVLACGMGMVVLGTWMAARAGHDVSPWVEVAKRNRQSDVLPPDPDSAFGEESLRPGASSVMLATTTSYATAVSVIGTSIALAGMTAAYRQRRGLPILCALGLFLCWLPPVASLLEELVLRVT